MTILIMAPLIQPVASLAKGGMKYGCQALHVRVATKHRPLCKDIVFKKKACLNVQISWNLVFDWIACFPTQEWIGPLRGGYWLLRLWLLEPPDPQTHRLMLTACLGMQANPAAIELMEWGPTSHSCPRGVVALHGTQPSRPTAAAAVGVAVDVP